MAEKSFAIGIDLGTTYSCVAALQHGKVEIIANEQGNRTTPSCVAFTDTERLLGDAAKNQIVTNPSNTVFDAKRLIGRSFDDSTVQNDMKHWPFKVVSDENEPSIEVDYKNEKKTFTPVEISSMILSYLKKTAEAYLNGSVKDAVITVPAYFNDSQRQATKDAAFVAGLNVLRIINEPTAAGVAYGMDKKMNVTRETATVLVFDLGGGTFDVSILSIDDGIFEVKATSGDTHLGGEDFDLRMIVHFVKEFKRKHKIDITTNHKALRRLKTACEGAKRQLSASVQANIEGNFDGIDISTSITRARFEDLCADLFRGTLAPVERALEDAKLDKSEIDDVILIGGSTRIPKIRKLLSDFFDGKKLNESINPDEAVAYGAAIGAAMLTEEPNRYQTNLVILDVTPLSLGMSINQGEMSVLIKRNTLVPCKKTEEFETLYDNQTSVWIKICQGEHELAEHNHKLGEFELAGIPPAPKRTQNLDVTFKMDANGILHASAISKTTGSTSEITISGVGRLSSVKIERMIKDAKDFEAADEEQREKIRAKTDLDSFCFQIKSALEEKFQKSAEPVLIEICDVLNWSEESQLAEAGDYRAKKMKVEASYYLWMTENELKSE